MSKSLNKFWDKWVPKNDFIARLTGRTLTPGSRVLPVNKKNDAAAEFRIDAGEKIGTKQNLVLQVNSQAKSPGLKRYVATNGKSTHGKLAAASFDTNASDPEAEFDRLVEEMTTQARDKLG